MVSTANLLLTLALELLHSTSEISQILRFADILQIAARTERTTRKPRMGHAMATAGRGPRLLRKGSLLRPGSLLKVCLSSCGAKLALAGCYVVWRHSTHFLRQLGDGDKAQDSAALVYNWQTKRSSLYKTCTLSVSYTHVEL